MSHLRLSLIKRPNKTESSVFNFWMMSFQKTPISDNLEITTSVVVPCGDPKKYPRTSNELLYEFTFSGPL